MPRPRYLLFLALTGLYLTSKAQQIKTLPAGPLCSIRGLSVVNLKTAWLSASKGYVGLTKDGGQSWKWKQVKGFEQSDFRDIQAFSNREALIMSSGNPALILRTHDGGENWQVIYRNNDKAYFFDAFDFQNNYGTLFGDPVNGHFLILETLNSGKTWRQMQQTPLAEPGEACFAASGTCVTIAGKKQLTFVTGGTKARLLNYNLLNKEWITQLLPLQQGQSSTGAFSVSMGNQHTIIVGGNYQSPLLPDSTACYSNNDTDRALTLSIQTPKGYQSCVTYIKKSTFVSTGTAGTHITYDAGKHWTQIDQASYNVCQKLNPRNLILLAGDKGRISILKID